MKSPLNATTLAVASLLALVANAAHAADDKLLVTTISPPTGTTDCTKDNFGYPLSERAAIVRGGPNHKIRIEKNGVDIGLERASISGCGSNCDARITRKGNFDSGRNDHLIDRKGFVELELNTPTSSSIGDATLVLHYALGGRGEYKLNIVQNSRVDRVERTTQGASAERFILTGNNLNKLRNSFSAKEGSAGSVSLTRVSEADNTLVLDRTARNCFTRTFDLELQLEAAAACVIKNVKLPMIRDATCDSGATPPPPPPPPSGPVQPPPPAPPAVRLNLTPALTTPTPFFRSLGALLPDNTAQRRQVADAFCATLGSDEESTITLPTIRWGIAYAGLQSPSAVSVDLLDANRNLLQRRTADPITVGNGSDVRFFDNWPTRSTSVRVIKAQSVGVKARMGLPPTSGQTPAGCYLAPSEPLTKFDPRTITIRVNTGTPPAVETQTNDNEITL